MSEQDEAREALEAIAATRRETARRAASPKGYYAVVGAGAALVIVGVAADGPARWALYALGIACMIGALSWYSRHTGMVAWATLREPGAWRAWAIVAVTLAALVVAVLLGLWPAIVAAVVTVLAWSILGPAWDADWVRSIEQQP